MKYGWLILLPTFAFGFNRDFTLVNDRSPYEFKQMFESMKYQLKTPEDQLHMIVLCQHLNKSLASLKKDQVYFLLKSEVFKNALEFGYRYTSFAPNSFTMKRLKEKLIENDQVYSSFSKWFIKALMADLAPFESDNILDSTLAQRASFIGEKQQKLLKLRKILPYVTPWIEKAYTSSAQDFNGQTLELSWAILEQAHQRALLFQKFARESVNLTQEMTFNIPEKVIKDAGQIIESNQTKPAAPEMNLSQRQELEKMRAESQTKKIVVDPIQSAEPDSLSEAIDQKIQDEKAPLDAPEWKPKEVPTDEKIR